MRWLRCALLLALLAIVGWVGSNCLRIAIVETEPHDLAGPGRGRWVHARDVELHVTERGPADDPVVVLVAGTGAWGGTWAGNVDALHASGWRVITVDLPPFGFSTRPADHDYSRQAQAQRLLAAIRQFGDAPVVLLGHSYGGGPAAEAAMLDPGRVRHLILVDAAIGMRTGGTARCDAGSLLSRTLEWRALRTALVASTATQPLFTPTLLRQFVYRKEAVTAQRMAIYREPLGVAGTSAAIGDWAYQFAVGCESAASLSPQGFVNLQPALTLIWGEQDTVTPPQQARAIAAAAHSARLIMLPGVGHIPQIEDSTVFNAALTAALTPLR